MSRKNPPRNIWEKFKEVLLALRLEATHSKDEILSIYASNAPFGGNVVGVGAAAWRYFGRNAADLSWAESALLAVLPNSPGVIFPGRKHIELKRKRDQLLRSLLDSGDISPEDYYLAIEEKLPDKPVALPQEANHLMHTLSKGKSGNRIISTLDAGLQREVSAIVSKHQQFMQANKVYNMAVVVADIRTRELLCYIGNTKEEGNTHSNMVDIVQSPRSTGSVLKPILYASALEEGLILPNTLIPDVPISLNGFSPKNYLETFDGAVPASKALSRSLNVPAVLMLKEYGYPKFYQKLRKMRFDHMTSGAEHYGLSLILGGAEASLMEIVRAYAGMGYILNSYNERGSYPEHPFGNLRTIKHEDEVVSSGNGDDAFPALKAGSIWSTYQALLEVNRPESELGWQEYSSSQPIAWKTGTSFGNRDAWAVGTTPEYVVGVWIGNATGEGRTGLTGLTAAAPVMFDVFGLLPRRTWFKAPLDELSEFTVCSQSGMKSSAACPHTIAVYSCKAGNMTPLCDKHIQIHLNKERTHQVSLRCYAEDQMVNEPWFVLEPTEAYYYSVLHPDYKMLPPFAEGCSEENIVLMSILQPLDGASIMIPISQGGKLEKLVLHGNHADANATLYWHIDGEYIGVTRGIHQLEIYPEKGKHKVTMVDQNGHSVSHSFTVFSHQ